jgi:hypothetical protein
MLTDQLRAEGVDCQYDARATESRGAGAVAVETTIWILNAGAKAVAGRAVLVAVQKAIRAVKNKWPREDIELKDVSDSP